MPFAEVPSRMALMKAVLTFVAVGIIIYCGSPEEDVLSFMVPRAIFIYAMERNRMYALVLKWSNIAVKAVGDILLVLLGVISILVWGVAAERSFIDTKQILGGKLETSALVGSEEGGLLLSMPFDPFLVVCSFLTPQGVDVMRGVCRSLRIFVVSNRKKLPYYTCSIEGDFSRSRGYEFTMYCDPRNFCERREVELLLPFHELSDLISALEEQWSGHFPSIGRFLEITSLSLKGDCDTELNDDQIATLNRILPARTDIEISYYDLASITYITLKDVVGKRKLSIEYCKLPRWQEELLDVQPVSEKDLSMHLQLCNEARAFLLSFLPLSTRVALSYYNDDDDWLTGEWPILLDKELTARLATTAKSLKIWNGRDECLPLLSAVPHLVFGSNCPILTTSGIRDLIQAYLDEGRTASASITLMGAEQAAFGPLSSGFAGNTQLTMARQLSHRRGTVMPGDTFFFKKGAGYVSMKCIKRFLFKITAGVGGKK